MEFYDYFSSYYNYFWQYEEDTSVIAIPGERTIVYTDHLKIIISHLAAEGLPSLSSVLLSLIATNPDGAQSLERSFALTTAAMKNRGVPDMSIKKAYSFLRILTELPAIYKKDDQRLTLFTTLYHNSHNRISVKESRVISDYFLAGKYSKGPLLPMSEFSAPHYLSDHAWLALLSDKYNNLEALLKDMSGIPGLKIDESLMKELAPPEDVIAEDFIEALIEDDLTHHIGTLVRRIWSGLNIPFHSILPSSQPLGGISDLTNKGDFDKLLISEFANDDIVFISRLANNEALYLHREIPPEDNDLRRVILVDVTLRTWGTPKTVAFATMLAIAKHPKTDIPCEVFAVGDSFYPLAFDTVHDVIDSLKVLDAQLNPASGIREYFKSVSRNSKREIFVISESSVLKSAAMMDVMNEFSDEVGYVIDTDIEGNIDVYKKYKKSRRHVQHLQLPIHELWRKQMSTMQVYNEEKLSVRIPMLSSCDSYSVKVLISPNGDICRITNSGTLIRSYDTTNKSGRYGSEILHEQLPIKQGDFVLGIGAEQQPILLMYDPTTRNLMLLDLKEGSTITTSVLSTKPRSDTGFVFEHGKFHFMHGGFRHEISLDGKVEETKEADIKFFTERRKEIPVSFLRLFSRHSILRNVNSVFINNANMLVINKHEVRVDGAGNLRMELTGDRRVAVNSQRIASRIFQFPDGSKAEVCGMGMIRLTSSNLSIPEIYIALVLEQNIAMATESYFAGSEFFLKAQRYRLQLIHGKPGTALLNALKAMTPFPNNCMQNMPCFVVGSPDESKLVEWKKWLEVEGGEAEIEREEFLFGGNGFQQKISPVGFYDRFLQSFINSIVAHGTFN